MAEKCEVKQINDCTKSGTGPNCSESAKVGGAAKQTCLEEVKRYCEERLKKCTEDCSANFVNPFVFEREARAAARAAAAAARAELERACREQAYYQQVDRELKEIAKHEAIIWRILRHKEFSLPPPVPKDFPGGLNEAELGWLDYYMKMDESDQRARMAEKRRFREHMEEVLEDFCNLPDLPEDPYDPCTVAEIRNAGSEISECLRGCYREAVGNCDTKRCYCQLYKCDGPDKKYDKRGGPEDDVPPGPGDIPDISPSTLSFSLSAYGIPIELVYTRAFMPGNVVWVSPVTEFRETRQVQVVDPATNENTVPRFRTETKLFIDNYISFHLGLCAGPIAGIRRIWLDGGLVYDVSESAQLTTEGQDRLSFRTLTGGEAAKVQAEEAHQDGFGRVPAYRGTAGVFIKDINVSDFDSFPDFKVEVVKAVDDEGFASLTRDAAGLIDFKVDIAARRIYAITTDGVNVYDYDTLELVNETIDIPNAIEFTNLPKVVALDGDDVTLHDITDGFERATIEVLETPVTIHPVRLTDSDNTTRDFLLTTSAAGDVEFTQYVDYEPRLAAYQNLATFLDGPAALVLQGRTLRLDASDTLLSLVDSVFAFHSTGTLIQVGEFVGNSPAGLDLIEDGEGILHTIEDIFDTANDVTIMGGMFTEYDRSFILFTAFDTGSTFRVIKWSPKDGVIWTVDTEEYAEFGSRAMARATEHRFLSWINASGDTERLDIDTGEIATRGTAFVQGAVTNQYYDPYVGAILFQDDDDDLVRLYVDRIAIGVETIADAIRDVTERAGIDPALVRIDPVLESVGITGWRTQMAWTGRAVIEPMLRVYPVGSFVSDRFEFFSRADADTVAVDQEDLFAPYNFRRNFAVYDTKSCALTYFSDNLDGEPATQEFSLPDDVRSGSAKISESYGVLETDDYMRRLAELRVFSAQENDEESSITIPWRYLAATPSDNITLPATYRAEVIEIGADMSMSIKLKQDSSDKYGDLVDLLGVRGFGALSQQIPTEPIGMPIGMSLRCVLPRSDLSACVYYGVSDVVADFSEPTKISSVASEYDPTPSFDLSVDRPVMYGRLLTAPAAWNSPFTTQLNGSLVVKFHSDSIGEYLEEMQTRRAPYREPELVEGLYYDETINLLMVGKEMIQFNSYEVDPDGVTVTFRHLFRARFCTDLDMAHTVGESVMLYDADYIERQALPRYKAPALSLVNDLHVLTFGKDETRAVDIEMYEPAFLALPTNRATRFDVAPDPGNESVEFPANPHIIIQADMRLPHAYPFLTNYPESGFPFRNEDLTNYILYLLRADYDEATFDIERAGAGAAYIIARDIVPGVVTLAETGQTEYFGYIFSTAEQDLAVWEAATEKLVAVTITTNAFGEETRQISTWTPGDYTLRRTRGM